jgi:hypothetical protein
MKTGSGSRCHLRWATSERKLEAEIINSDLATRMLSEFELVPLLVPEAVQLDGSSLTGWTRPSEYFKCISEFRRPNSESHQSKICILFLIGYCTNEEIFVIDISSCD